MFSNLINRTALGGGSLAVLLLLGNIAPAHFVFVKSVPKQGGEGREAVVYFSESSHLDGERLPDKIKATKLWLRSSETGKRTERRPVEEDRDGWIAMFDQLGTVPAFSLEAHCDYGLHHGTMLRYRAKHLRFSDAAALKQIGRAQEFDLDIVPEVHGSKLKVTTLWKGKPLADCELAIELADEELEERSTNAQGSLSIDIAKPGFYSIRANHNESEKGTHDGEDYEDASYYTTLTLHVGENAKPAAKEQPAKVSSHSVGEGQNDGQNSLLPEALSSFGGVVCGEHLYVYSGHTGKAHDHSKHNLSPHFRRISLREQAGWESLPAGTPLQGLPLVTYQGAVYRVGGLQAFNDDVDSPDLHSTSEFARFDPGTKTWTSLVNLPQARSSHDAVVVDNTLYVVGGWKLNGDEEGEWHEHALAADLSQSPIVWKRIATPFQRRALAVSHANGKLYAIGGMNADHEVVRSVSVYDPTTNEWSDGPELPGEGMQGFGASAWNLGGHVYVSGTDERVFRLANDGTAWIAAQKLLKPRFFHRLVPAPNGGLLAVGGASLREGHLRDIEPIALATTRELSALSSQQDARE